MRNKGNNCNTSNYYYNCHNKNIHRNKVELTFKFKVALNTSNVNKT